jgi:protein unc-80
MPPSQPRRRSNSLPIPHIEISLYQGPGSNSRDSPSNSSAAKDYIEVPDPTSTTLLTDTPVQKAEDQTVMGAGGRRGSEKKRRVKMADLRTLIETKILSKSDRGLEKVGVENGTNGNKNSDHPVSDSKNTAIGQRILNHKMNLQECHRSLDTGEKHLSRSASLITRAPSTNLVKGSSMPSLR